MSEFILQIERLASALGDAEYRYLLLEPLILYGVLIGVAMLLLGFFMKAPKLQLAALITVGVAAFAHVPYKDARLAAQPRMEQVYKLNSPARVKGFNENTQAWVASTWKFRLLVLSSALAIMIGINRNRIGFGLGVATALLGLLVAKNTMWLHYQDAIAYHPNLIRHSAPIDERRTAVAPSARAQEITPAALSPSTATPPSAPSSSAAGVPSRPIAEPLPQQRIAPPPSPPSASRSSSPLRAVSPLRP
jgi:hypothetical protein